jgi:flagellar assembly protein FliH
LEFVPHPDGSVTLKMKEGYDEWGNLIPEPEPENEPEPEPEPEPEVIDDTIDV